MTHSYIVHTITTEGSVAILTVRSKHGRGHFDFMPGQYATLGMRRNDRPTPVRCFSIASAPSDELLRFGIRIEGDFTQSVAALQPGDTVKLQGPFGNFVLDPQYDRHAVMLAAGIGITPFISMLRDATARGLNMPINLLYSNRSNQDIPFYDELQTLAQANPNIRIKYFASDIQPDGATNVIQGRITDQYLAKIAAKPQGRTYFICGPDGFSSAMANGLRANGVGDQQILNESFAQAQPDASGVDVRMWTYKLAAATLILAVAFIGILDLSRSVPQLTASQNAAAAQATTGAKATEKNETQEEPASSNTAAGTSDDSSAATPATSQTTTPTPAPAATQTAPTPTPTPAPNPQPVYQPPVSRVS